jgi:hypothetical protein
VERCFGLTNDVNRDYSFKPAVRIGSYYFKWSDNDYGICPSESSVFKNFIRKMIPLLEYYMNILKFEYKNTLHKKNLLGDKKHKICVIEKYKAKVSFIMFIDSAGSTVFYREEKFQTGSKDLKNFEGGDHHGFGLQTPNNRLIGHNIVSLKWLLGELLFDRIKTTNTTN